MGPAVDVGYQSWHRVTLYKMIYLVRYVKRLFWFPGEDQIEALLL